ncbi:MAG: class I SAM-dependent methyltransferase [Mycobacterium sp.]
MPSSPSKLGAPGVFDAGDGGPYARALRDPGRTLYLREEVSPEAIRLDVERFLGGADGGDSTALEAATGPVLDIGCGPGRFVRAAILAGHLTLGIDISETAVHIAQEHGLPVLRRSVFQDLPGEGTWGTVLLIDGNIGIGGDPAALLRRCAELIRVGDGRILVEVHPDPRCDRVFVGVLVDDLDNESSPFPWAEVGAEALQRYAGSAGLVVCREWSVNGRSFAECASA